MTTNESGSNVNLGMFKKIELKDIALFRSLSRDIVNSDISFTDIFLLSEVYDYRYLLIDNHIVIRSFSGDGFFLEPLGQNPSAMIQKILASFPDSKFEMIEEKVATLLSDKFIVEEDRDSFDYVYDVSILVSLEGRKYSAKRNFIKRFSANSPLVVNLTPDLIPACLALQKKWCEQNNCAEDEEATMEDMAITNALSNFESLDLFGICLLVGDKLVGFAVGEKLNADTVLEHFEKADSSYQGAYQFLLNSFAKSLPKEIHFLNREEDMGKEGLRKAKESWYPSHYVKKYTIKNKN
jgi:hypothetical protein